MNLAELLDKAEDAPLGPLTLKATSDGQDAWWLSLTLAGHPPVSVRVVHDRPNAAIRLDRNILSQIAIEKWQAALDSRPWIADLAPIAGGGVVVRIFLSDLDLQLNTLLMAASDLARIERLAAASTATSSSRVSTAAKPVSWQTMGSDPPVPAPAPAPEPVPTGNFCKECGTLRPPSHTFCTNCGASLT